MNSHFLIHALLTNHIYISSEENSNSFIIIDENCNLNEISILIQKNPDRKVIIKGGLENIPNFPGLTYARNIEINAEKIKEITKNLFMNNNNITSVKLCDNIKYIGNFSFFNSSISDINLENIISIGYFAFSKCKKLKTVNFGSLNSIEPYCFANSAIREIHFPASLTKVSDFACMKCCHLKVAEIYKIIGSYAFYKCKSLCEIKNSNNVSEIGSFSLCYTNLTEVEFGENVQNIRLSYLAGSPIKKIVSKSYIEFDFNIETVRTVIFNAMVYSISIRNMNIEELQYPYGTEGISISDCPNIRTLHRGFINLYCANNLISLEEVDLSDCQYIAENSFFYCPNLTNVIGWADHPMSVGQQIFQLCYKIDISIWNENISAYSIESEIMTFRGVLDHTYITEMNIFISDDFTTFYDCKKLKNVVFAEGIERIYSYQFKDCISLTEVVLPNSIKSIGKRAFENTKVENINTRGIDFCINSFNNSHIKELYISRVYNKTEYFHYIYGQNVMWYVSVIFSDAEAYWINQEEFENNDYMSNTKYLIQLPFLEKIILSDELDSFTFNLYQCEMPNLREIETHNDSLRFENGVLYSSDYKKLYAYASANTQNEFTIPSSVEYVEKYAFTFAKNLEKIISHIYQPEIFRESKYIKTIEFTCQVNKFEENTFKNCVALEKIVIPNDCVISYLGPSCFQNCKTLRSLTFSYDLEDVGISCFRGCTNLTSVNMARVTLIRESLFLDSNVEEMNITGCNSLIKISSGAFNHSNIKEVVCPDNLEIIESEAFSNCLNLRSLQFNEKIFYLGDRSFANTKLGNVYIPNSMVTIDPNAFYNCFDISFQFHPAGHPLFHTYQNCFMNRANLVLFTFGRQRNIVSDEIKGVESLNDHYSIKLINLVVEDARLNLEINPLHYIEQSITVTMEKDFENRYTKLNSDYSTYIIPEDAFESNPDFHSIQPIETYQTYEFPYINSSLPFFNLKVTSNLVIVLITSTILLFICIVCLSVILFIKKR